MYLKTVLLKDLRLSLSTSVPRELFLDCKLDFSDQINTNFSSS